MANADTPFGLRPVGKQTSGYNNGGVRMFATDPDDTQAIFIGDPVTLRGDAQVIDGQTYPEVQQAVTTGIIAGVVVGVLPVTDESLLYRAASTQRLLFVNTDPQQLYEIQEVSGGTALAAADIGLNAAFVVGSGSTVTGLSGVELNNSGEGSGATLDLKIIGLVNRPDNEVGEHAKWLVQINRHQYADQIAGA